MRWFVGLILGLCLVFSASASQGEWMLTIHKGATFEDHALADIDSLTFHEAPSAGMVLVPAGTFTMGSPTDETGRYDNETQHQVTLTKAIYVSKYEVTQADWQAVMGWNESTFPGENRPVEQVTWFDVVSYCNQRSTGDGYTPAYTITSATYDGNHIASATVTWHQPANGYRPLTEAEWEYDCRAGSTTAFCNGGITYTGCANENLECSGAGLAREPRDRAAN